MDKNILIKKDAYFNTNRLETGKTGKPYLEIDDFSGCATFSISDAEIKDDVNSPEVVLLDIGEHDGNDNTIHTDILIHKKDIIPLVSFLMNVYNDYVMKHNEIDWNDFCEQHKKLMTKNSIK